MLLLALVWSPPGWAGKYAYGEKFVRVDQSWSDAAPFPIEPVPGSLDPDPDPDPDPEAEGYTSQLQALEDGGGPYSDALAEPLAGLGRFYRINGDLEEAMRLYQRALHVVRINDGLYSERQVPILQELLHTYRLSGDMQALDSRYSYYFRLYGNGKPPYTGLRLRASLAYLRWQREAVRLGIDEDEGPRLLSLYRLNDELLKAIGSDASVDLSVYRDLALSQLRNLYLLEDRYAPTVENKGLATELPMVGGEWDQGEFNRRRLEMIQRGALSQGSDLLQDVIARTGAAGDNTELARLHLELGDWYQWHGKESRAGEQYRQVGKLLLADSERDLLEQWLGQPVELPDNGAFWQPAPSPGERSPVVTVSYDVSAQGRARNMSAEVIGPQDKGPAISLKRKLGQIRFRPRWVNGEAEPVVQLQRDYQLIKR